jgi:hypothetical protein
MRFEKKHHNANAVVQSDFAAAELLESVKNHIAARMIVVAVELEIGNEAEQPLIVHG